MWVCFLCRVFSSQNIWVDSRSPSLETSLCSSASPSHYGPSNRAFLMGTTARSNPSLGSSTEQEELIRILRMLTLIEPQLELLCRSDSAVSCLSCTLVPSRRLPWPPVWAYESSLSKEDTEGEGEENKFLYLILYVQSARIHAPSGN